MGKETCGYVNDYDMTRHYASAAGQRGLRRTKWHGHIRTYTGAKAQRIQDLEIEIPITITVVLIMILTVGFHLLVKSQSRQS